MRTSVTLLALSTVFLASCARITLREAMQEVQKRYIALTRTLETGLVEPKNFEARRRADDLRAALDVPIVRSENPFAGEEDFQGFLAAAIEAIERVNSEASRFDAYELWSVRDGISYACQDCHDAYRR